jgi:Glycoside hydrolase 97/Glycosyl-hydrolase 97 C-terminal, oligomerisation
LPWSSQWHLLIIGKLSDIVESTLITDVSESNKLKNTSWIKPGPVAWIYWANNHGSKDYQKVVEYIDLAIAMNWPYVLIDWEWDQMSNGGNIIDAVNYAKSKGIKPLLWYNSGTIWLGATPADRLLTHEKREKEFKWLNKIGVYGIKVDFFAGDQQDMMKYYIDILRDAAKYHLMVNFHGATIPRGWARTYPNLMTMEAVYGAEWYNNAPVLTNKAAVHNTTLPFTRNVIGSMDYTPVTFSNSQHPHITTYGHELALSVVFESGLQHFADRPSAYESLPVKPKEFLEHVPVAWDDTKLVDGYPGKKIIIARRKGNKWYIGGLNGEDENQTLIINFNFLGKGNYNLQLIKDGNNDKSFSYEYLKVKKGDIIKIDCLPRGGFVGILNLQNINK